MVSNILVLMDLSEQIKPRLEAMLPSAKITYAASRAPSEDEVAAAEIIIGNLPPDRLKTAVSLKWMQLGSAGSEAYHRGGFWPKGAVLTCAAGTYSTTISEHMTAMALAFMRKLPLYWEQQNQALWRGESSMLAIHGSKTCVIGLGDIGGAFARILNAMGSRVTGVRRTLSDKPDYVERLVCPNDIPEVIRDADVVALALPATQETRHILSRELIFSLRQNAIVLNVGRGSAIDTEALCDALEQERIYAGLDVTDPEPLPPDHRLWSMKNAIITPHVSGGFSLEVTRQRFVNLLMENLDAFTRGEKLRSVVDFGRGY